MLIVTDKPPLTPEALAAVKVDIDYAGWKARRGSHWKGVPHAALLAELRAAVASLTGQPTADCSAWTTRRGGNLYAHFRVVGPNPSFDTWVGVSASNVGAEQLRVYAGAARRGTRLVTDCTVGGKYSTALDLVAECRSLAAGWRAAAVRVPVAFNELSLTPLTPGAIDGVLLDACRAGCLTYKHVPHVLKSLGAWGTASDLLAAFSLGTANRSVEHQLRDLLAFHKSLTKHERTMP